MYRSVTRSIGLLFVKMTLMGMTLPQVFLLLKKSISTAVGVPLCSH